MAKKKKRRHTGRVGSISILFVILILLGTLGVKSLELRHESKEYKKQEEELKEDLADEKLRAKEIEELSKYVQTKQYVEQIAKEKLGLVSKDETIFKEVAE